MVFVLVDVMVVGVFVVFFSVWVMLVFAVGVDAV